MTHNFKKGFTLIELLVVISIIALLSTIVLSALQDARAKARDRSLVSAVMQLQNAIEIYKTNSGIYPGQDTTSVKTIGRNPDGTFTAVNPSLISALETHIESFPVATVGPISYFVNYSTSRKCGANGTNQPYIISFTPETSALDNFPSQFNNSGGVWSEQSDRKCISIQ